MKQKSYLILMFFSFMAVACKKEDSPNDSREKFTATYIVSEVWKENNTTMNKPQFSLMVERSSVDKNRILIANFANYGFGVTIEALLKGKEITIPEQSLPNYKTISGSGSFSDSTMNLIYTEVNGSLSLTITAVGRKK